MPGRDGLLLRHADEPDLRVGEDGAGDHAVVHLPGCVARERVVRHDRPVVGTHRGGHLALGPAPDDVARRPDVRDARAQVPIHDDRALRVQSHPDLFQADICRVRAATGGDEQPFGAQFVRSPVPTGGHDHLRPLLAHPLHRSTRAHRDPLLDEQILEHLTDLGLVAVREELVAALQQGDPGAEAGEHLPQLQGDIPAAHDDERRGEVVQFQRLAAGKQIAGEVGHLVEPVDGWDNLPGAEGDEELVSGQLPLPHREGARVEEAHRPRNDGDLVGLVHEAVVFLAPVVVDGRIFLGDQRAEIGAQIDRLEAGIARVPRVVGELGGLNEVLRGEAAAIDAGTADSAVLGHRDRLAQLGGAQRGGEGGRAGAQNHQVVVRGGRHGVLLSGAVGVASSEAGRRWRRP